MTNHLPIHTKLSSIMEVMMTRVCKLVDDDLTGLRSELARVLLDNARLCEKVQILECELALLGKRSDVLKPAKHFRSIGVQAGDMFKDGADPVDRPPSPTIEGIYGKDWCMNLWKDVTTQCSEMQSMEQSSEEVIIKEELKEEDCEVEIATSCQKETHKLNVSDGCTSRRAEGPFVDDSVGVLSVDQFVAAVGLPEESLTIDGAMEEHSSTHVIPIDEDDPANTQFIKESKKELSGTIVGEPTQIQPQSLPVNSENDTDLYRETCSTYNTVHLQTTNNTDKDQFTCKICDETFFHKRNLTLHMKTHKSDLCQICGQSSRDKTHKCIPPVPLQKSNTTCTLCGITFGKSSALKIHDSRVHTGKKAHVCTMCGKGFSQKGNLKSHLSIHTGEKPFHCGYCGKTFRQLTSLNYHLMTHEKNEENARRSKRLKK